MNEKSGARPTESTDDAFGSSEIAMLVLDSPIFAEGEFANGSPRGFRAIRTVNLLGETADWLAMDGTRVTIAVSAGNVLFPSDVQPCDAKAFDARPWQVSRR